MMAEKGEWEEIHKKFKGPDLDAEKHPKLAAIAEAIARYEEIKKNPDQFRKTVPGENTVDEAIGTIYKEWGDAEIDSSEPLVKQVEENRIAAIESATKWKSNLSDAKEKIDELQKDLEKHLKASPELVSKQANELTGSLKALKADCENWNKASLESASLSLTVVKESILPALATLEQIDREYPVDEDLKQLSEDAALTSDHLSDEIRKIEAWVNKEKDGENFRKAVSEVCNALMARFQELSFEGGFAREEPPPVPTKAAPPKPDPAVTAETEAKKDKIPPKTILIEAQTGGVIDLSGFDGAPEALPRNFDILPVSALLGGAGEKELNIEEIVKDFYYTKPGNIRILGNPKGLTLKKEEKGEREIEFWKSFRGGFILRLPKGADPADDVRYLVLDKIPVGQGSETLEPWTMKPCESFLKNGAPGEVAISDSVVAILKRVTRVADDPPKYRLTLRREFSLASGWVEDPSQIKLPLSAKVNDEISRLEGQKTQQGRLVKAKGDFNLSYANLGGDLFPQFFGESKVSETFIVDKKNPRERKDLPKVIKTFAEFVDKESVNHLDRFTKYVADLFNQLNELAGDDPRHASANADFERLIKSLRDLKAEGILTREAVGWIEVTKLSKDAKNKWGDSTATPASVSLAQTKENEEQIQKDFQRKYFDDFFKVWNERFSEEAVKKLIDDLSLIQTTPVLQADQLDSTLKTLEETKSRLENNDLTDDGEYTLELMLETPNSGSPQIIPLIRGTR